MKKNNLNVPKSNIFVVVHVYKKKKMFGKSHFLNRKFSEKKNLYDFTGMVKSSIYF